MVVSIWFNRDPIIAHQFINFCIIESAREMLVLTSINS